MTYLGGRLLDGSLVGLSSRFLWDSVDTEEIHPVNTSADHGRLAERCSTEAAKKVYLRPVSRSKPSTHQVLHLTNSGFNTLHG